MCGHCKGAGGPGVHPICDHMNSQVIAVLGSKLSHFRKSRGVSLHMVSVLPAGGTVLGVFWMSVNHHSIWLLYKDVLLY